jgi:uncharacterized protein YodC (DUF2158 family)
MAEAFKEGDTVRLKSNGPLMTVAGVSQSGAVECHWFNHTGSEFTPKFEQYRPAMLKRVTLND